MIRLGRALAGLLLPAMVAAAHGCTAPGDPAGELQEKLERYVAYWNTADFEGIEDLLAPDFALRESPRFEPAVGIERFQETVRAYHESYPGFRLTVDEAVYGRDAVAGIWTIRTTGSPTGPGIAVTGMAVLHFADGKIRDEWISGNDYEWYSQLGYTFEPPTPAEPAGAGILRDSTDTDGARGS